LFELKNRVIKILKTIKATLDKYYIYIYITIEMNKN